MPCGVKFHIYKPTLDSANKATVPYIAVVSVGIHTHPPPPPSKIPEDVRQVVLSAIKAHGVNSITASRLMASNMLPRLLNNSISLNMEHASLLNTDRVNSIIRRERMKENPAGTDFLGKHSESIN